MLHQFRNFYPQGSLISELINIDRGLYIVKVTLKNQEIILGTGLAAAETIEKAEDKARERALMILNLEKSSKSANIPVQSSVTQPVAAIKTTETISTPTTHNHNFSSVTPTPSEIKTDNSQQNFNPPQPREEKVKEDFLANTNLDTNSLKKDETPSSQAFAEPQINIFDQPMSSHPVEESPPEETTDVIELDFNDIKHKTDLEMKRLGWTKEQGRDYLLSTYGKRSRLHLDNLELLEFLEYLENLPN